MRQRRIRLEGHYVRQESTELALWQTHGGRTSGKRRSTSLLEDTELATVGEIRTAIVDRINLRKRTHMPRADLSK